MAAIFTQTPAQKAFAIKEHGVELIEQYGERRGNVFMLSLADIIRELESILEDDDLPEYFRSEVEQCLESL